MDLCGHFGHKGSVSLRPCRWITGPEEQKMCQAVNNAHFFMAFVITKTSSYLPWWSLCTRAVLLLFEEIPVAHTGFPIHIPEGFLKGTQSPSSKFQRRTACPPSQTVCSGDTLRPVLLSRDVPGRKQNNRMAPHQTNFSFKGQNWIPQRQWKSPHLQHLCGLQRSTPPESSQVRHRQAFTKVTMGQSTTSVLRLTGRNRTLWCCPRCWSQTACPLCFIRSSKIHWPSSIAQKGSISKPCPLRLGPGPLSVGKVSVAFVQVHGTQTAARQGQAADLYSRLRQSMAAPAQTQRPFG